MKKAETAEYTVLVDGKEIAGVRSPGKDKTVTLTAEQAEHPLRTGLIEKAPTKKSEKE